MLYLETPVGVGFSYSTDTSSYADVNDKITGIFPPVFGISPSVEVLISFSVCFHSQVA